MSDRIVPRRARRHLGLGVCLSLALTGCSYVTSYIHPSEGLKQRPGVVAVLPVAVATNVPEGDVLPEADRVLTAQIYGILAQYPIWNWIPDSQTADELLHVPKEGPIEQRAIALGKADGADSVLCGTVLRYQERIGGPYGASQPASIAFTLSLVAVRSGEVLWTGGFDQTQEPLTSNVLNFWQFWRAGSAKWFSAQEYAQIAVEHVIEDLKRRIQATPVEVEAEAAPTP